MTIPPWEKMSLAQLVKGVGIAELVKGVGIRPGHLGSSPLLHEFGCLLLN
jgi:hypothetical protein